MLLHPSRMGEIWPFFLPQKRGANSHFFLLFNIFNLKNMKIQTGCIFLGHRGYVFYKFFPDKHNLEFRLKTCVFFNQPVPFSIWQTIFFSLFCVFIHLCLHFFITWMGKYTNFVCYPFFTRLFILTILSFLHSNIFHNCNSKRASGVR